MTKYIILTFLIISNFFVWTNIQATEDRKGYLEISFLNIGQGDSMIIKTPNNHFGIIDAGKDNKVMSELSEVLPLGRNYLDFAILTHLDADHIGGFVEVFRNYRINKIFVNKNQKTNELIDLLKDQIEVYNIKNYSIDMDNDFTLDGVSFDFTWPEDHTKTYTFSNSNDASTSVLLKYSGYRLLAMGDLASEFEASALENIAQEDKDIDFLKVSHHGSKHSTSADFLKVIKPEYSFISAGKDNSYGHPTKDVLDNLTNANSQIFRTDLDGRITLKIKDYKGEITTVKSFKKIEIAK